MATCNAANASARPCCTGHTTAERSDGIGADYAFVYALNGSGRALRLLPALLCVGFLRQIRKEAQVMPVSRHDVLPQPPMSDLDRLVRHASLVSEGFLRQIANIGMKPSVFFSMPRNFRVVEALHHAFLQRKMLLQQIEEFDNFGFGAQFIVIGRPLRYSHEAVENASVLEIQRRYSDRIFVLPFQVFHIFACRTAHDTRPLDLYHSSAKEARYDFSFFATDRFGSCAESP